MSIISWQIGAPGQGINTPRRNKLTVTDSLATITAANYLNSFSKLIANPVFPTDVWDVEYLYSAATRQGTYGEFNTTISNGVITLVQNVSQGNIPLPSLPTVSGDVVQFNSTTGTVSDSGVLVSNLVKKNTTNNMAAGSTITLAKVNGTEAANAVTASGVAGVITTSALTTAGGSSYPITWTNTFMTATSAPTFAIVGGTNTTQNITFTCVPGAGTATLTIFNNTAATALNGTIFIAYTLS